MRIIYPDGVKFDETGSIFRCYDFTCTATETDGVKSYTVEHTEGDKMIKISNIFADSDFIRETGKAVKFSLNGFELPATTAVSVTKKFIVETYFTFEGSEYAIDKHTDFDLVLVDPTNKLTLNVIGTATAGSVGTLEIVYELQRDWLLYSWFVMQLPKLNRDSE